MNLIFTLIAVSSFQLRMGEAIFPLFLIAVVTFIISFPALLLLYAIYWSIRTITNIFCKKKPYLHPIYEGVFIKLLGVALLISLLNCLYNFIFIGKPWTW